MHDKEFDLIYTMKHNMLISSLPRLMAMKTTNLLLSLPVYAV